MEKGKQLGDFSLKSTSVTVTPGPAGSTLTQVNFEGTVGGAYAGTNISTATFVGGKSGTFTQCGTVYADNGEEVSYTSVGTYESTGKHHWRTQQVNQVSNGGSLVVDGELDLATRTWTGKYYEKS
jgi:hypothetical protein